MKEEIQDYLNAYRNLQKSYEKLSIEFAENEDYRNRPNRQKLMTELACLFPNPYRVGKMIDKIAAECDIEL